MRGSERVMGLVSISMVVIYGAVLYLLGPAVVAILDATAALIRSYV